MFPKIISVIPKPNFTLELEFENKIWKEFSIIPYLEFPVFKPLKDASFFNQVIVKYDTVVWGKEEVIDFDPFTLWTESIEITKPQIQS
ncbi:DUF2442 domain-containing protein [Flavobacterium sp.]|uniref:DUF2442 domain-containing protein n=1 Tax=Flavobacterium sp. TaxID=239 RepID=UPI00375104A9